MKKTFFGSYFFLVFLLLLFLTLSKSNTEKIRDHVVYLLTSSSTSSSNEPEELKTSSIPISPEEQKAIAILHYTQSGTTSDPYRFFKYDDYISYCTTTGINACDISIVTTSQRPKFISTCASMFMITS